MTEQWRPVYGWPLYEASSYGRVRRSGEGRGAVVGRVLRPMRMRGYRFVSLRTGPRGYRQTVGVHQAVALAFIGPCPVGKEVGHKDHRRSHNIPDNLAYVTRQENVHASTVAGRMNRGEQHGHAKLTRRAVLAIRKQVGQGISQKLVGQHFGVAFQTVSKIARGTAWGWL